MKKKRIAESGEVIWEIAVTQNCFILVIVGDLNSEGKESIKLLEEQGLVLKSFRYSFCMYLSCPGRGAMRFLCCLSSQVCCPHLPGSWDIYYWHCVAVIFCLCTRDYNAWQANKALSNQWVRNLFTATKYRSTKCSQRSKPGTLYWIILSKLCVQKTDEFSTPLYNYGLLSPF